MKKKAVILGAGHVGSHCAFSIAATNAADEIVLVDTDAEKASSQALDVADATAFFPGAPVVRAGDYGDCADADIIFVAIGCPRLPGQTRLDVLDASAVMLRDCAVSLAGVSPRGIIVTVTNPADVINYMLLELGGFDSRRCFSTGTALDTARLKQLLHQRCGAAHGSIEAYVMGEHGDSSVIAFSALRINGEKPSLREEELLSETRMRGMDIINGKGSTEFGIGAVCAQIAQAVLGGEKLCLPLSTRLCGEYGQNNVCAGVPCVLGESGIERIIRLPLTERESEMFGASCDVIRSYIARAL